MMHGKPYGKMSDEDKMYQAERDCDTLVDAEEIKKDKPRMKAAMKYAKEKMKSLKAVHGGNPGKEDNPGEDY